MIELEAERTKGTIRVLAFLSHSEEVLQSAGKKAAKAAAERFLEQLKQNWVGQRGILWPLKQAYQSQKQKDGLDSRILIATGELLGSLQIIEHENGFTVAPPTGQKHSKTGIDLQTLLKILEYGSPSRNLPPRPIMRQTEGALRKELMELFKQEFQAELKRQIGF